MVNTKLVLFFTEGVSLQTWKAVGNLERELALYKRLTRQQIDVEMVTYGTSEDSLLRNQLMPINLRCNRFGMPDSFYKWSVEWFPPKGDVYKSNQIVGSDVALRAARKAKAKFIARCGYLLSEFESRQNGSESPGAIGARQLENMVFHEAHRVVVTTLAMADSVRSRYGISEANLRVIPNYVDTEIFIPKLKAKYQTPRIITIGRLEPQKNYRALIEAVGPLDVEIVFIGDGSEKQELEQKTRGARARFQFLGNLPNAEIAKLLPGCDLFVLPSLYEGHPKALLEAMACGVPVVGTQVPGIQELIRHGENGFLSDLDAGSIRKAILQVLGDAHMQKRLGSSARKFIEDNFSLDRILELEFSLINELMTKTHANN